jgi:hypothetical protein
LLGQADFAGRAPQTLRFAPPHYRRFWALPVADGSSADPPVEEPILVTQK